MLPTQTPVKPLLIQRKQVENWKAYSPSLLLQRMTKSRTNPAAAMLRPDEYSPEPWRELLVAGQIVRAQRTRAKKLLASKGDERERQLLGLHVRAKLVASRLEGLIAENVAIMLKYLPRKRRNELRMVDQVIDLQCLTRLRRPCSHSRQELTCEAKRRVVS